MKKIYTLFAALLLTLTIQAQSPDKMSYQAVIRDGNNQVLSNQVIRMQISILQGGSFGTVVFAESQFSMTNTNGLVSVQIGTGNLLHGQFSAIDWSQGPYFIKTETDPNGGTNYSITATSQLLSVPYALHAKTADNCVGSGISEGSNVGGINYWNGSEWVEIPPAENEGATLKFIGGVPTWSDCNSTPLLTTGGASEIDDISATLSGSIGTSSCGSSVTSQGFVYSKTAFPKVSDNVVEVDGENIYVNISELEQNTTYYYRTYLTNVTGTYYGDQKSFATYIGGTKSNISTITNITAISAEVAVEITSNGGGEISAQGVCWSTNSGPTTEDFKTVEAVGEQVFTSEISGLTPNLMYYVRSYVTNESGTTYGEERSFFSIENLNITTLIYTLTSDTDPTDVVVFNFKDLDTDGPIQPIITNGVLKANTEYSGSIIVLNENEEVNMEDEHYNVTLEIDEEKDELQFFYLNMSGITMTYDDTDNNGNAYGLKSKMITGEAGIGTFTIRLILMPNKNAPGVVDGDISNAGGSTNIIAEFNTIINEEIVYEGNYQIHRQEDLDSFKYKGYTKIKGDLVLENISSISNLDGLESLTSIEGSLWILQNNALTSIQGLKNLKHVSQEFGIGDNSMLTSLDGLESLTSVGGFLHIDYHDELISISGLKNLESVGGTIQIEENKKLTSLDGFEKLINIGKNIYIVTNPSLITLSGLQNLESVVNLSIWSNNDLRDFCPISELEIKGTYSVYNNYYNPTKEQLSNGQCR